MNKYFISPLFFYLSLILTGSFGVIFIYSFIIGNSQLLPTFVALLFLILVSLYMYFMYNLTKKRLISKNGLDIFFVFYKNAGTKWEKISFYGFIVGYILLACYILVIITSGKK